MPNLEEKLILEILICTKSEDRRVSAEIGNLPVQAIRTNYQNNSINLKWNSHDLPNCDVKIDFRDPNDMHEIRQMIGVCPQQDVLFDLLSVKEHLQFFAAVKVWLRNNICMWNRSFLLLICKNFGMHYCGILVDFYSDSWLFLR